MVVAAAPAEAAHLVEVVLQPLLDLPAAERSRLLETLEHWYAAAGSATDAARSLFVHPNTVRYRLAARRSWRSAGQARHSVTSFSDVTQKLDCVLLLASSPRSAHGFGGPRGPRMTEVVAGVPGGRHRTERRRTGWDQRHRSPPLPPGTWHLAPGTWHLAPGNGQRTTGTIDRIEDGCQPECLYDATFTGLADAAAKITGRHLAGGRARRSRQSIRALLPGLLS